VSTGGRDEDRESLFPNSEETANMVEELLIRRGGDNDYVAFPGKPKNPLDERSLIWLSE
jgi:hypothetical protein